MNERKQFKQKQNLPPRIKNKFLLLAAGIKMVSNGNASKLLRAVEMARKCEITDSFRITSKKCKYLSIKVTQFQFDLMGTCYIVGTGCNLKPEEINSGFLCVHHSCDRRVFLSAPAARHASGTTCRFFFPNKHRVIYCQTADHTKRGQSIDEEREESAGP